MIDPRPYTYQYRKPRLNNPTYQSSNLYESLYHMRIPQKSDYIIPKDKIDSSLSNVNNGYKLPKYEAITQRNQYNQNPQQFQKYQQSSHRYQSYGKINTYDGSKNFQKNYLDMKNKQSNYQQDNFTNRNMNINNPNINNNSINNISNSIKSTNLLKKEVQSNQDRRNQPKNNSAVQSHLMNYGQNLMRGSQFDRFSIYEKQQKGYNIINCNPSEMQRSLRAFPKLTLENKLIQNGQYIQKN